LREFKDASPECARPLVNQQSKMNRNSNFTAGRRLIKADLFSSAIGKGETKHQFNALLNWQMPHDSSETE
jgi:hypothetical protein